MDIRPKKNLIKFLLPIGGDEAGRRQANHDNMEPPPHKRRWGTGWVPDWKPQFDFSWVREFVGRRPTWLGLNG